MKTFLLLLFFAIAANCYSQSSKVDKYLLVRLNTDYDVTTKKTFTSIIAEGGCDSAIVFYLLKKFNTAKNAVNTEASYYYLNGDTATVLYNYFQTNTEALNFIAKKGWTLISTYIDIWSGYNTERGDTGLMPVTTVASRPVFCFKKINKDE